MNLQLVKKGVAQKSEGQPFFNTKMVQMIESSFEVLMLSICPEEFLMIQDAILKAEKRGVKVIAG